MTQTARAASLPHLEKYEVVEEIGHGGMATVFRARDRRLGRDVAVKIIHRHLRESVEVAKRFSDEARAVAKLRHPGIVEIFDVSGDDEHERYLVAELVRGKSLRKVLTEERALPPEIAASVAVELAEALAHAHERDVVHRDVKPENVLFGFCHGGESGKADGAVEVKITDFGIAKMLDQQGVTATGQVLGSPAYMAPEQIECGEVDARADVFGLGVLLYEAMVGHPPFEGRNPAQVLRRVLDGQFSPPEREVPEIGAVFARIVSRMLAQQPSARPASMGEVARALSDELQALGISDRAAELAAFFAEPAAYRRELPARLAPRLFARGQAAERAGDVVAAADHYNRALAETPGDAAILAHISRLSRGRSRRSLAKKAGLGAALALVVGAALLGARQARSRREAPASVAPSASAEPVAEPSARAPDPAPSASASVVASATSAPTISLIDRGRVATGGVAWGGPPVTHDRGVRFRVFPKSVMLSIDGGPPFAGDGSRKNLAVGVHTVVGSVGAGNPCCDKVTKRVEVKDDGDTDLEFTISLPFRAATLVSDGPTSAQVRCPQLNVFIGGKSSARVEMSKSEETARCTLFDAGTVLEERAVTLMAGDTTRVSWRAR